MAQFSFRKIVWPEIEFVVSPAHCLRAYAYHKKDRCGAYGAGKPYVPGIAQPKIVRYRVFVDDKKVSEDTVCDACWAPVGKSAQQRLENIERASTRMEFGPKAANVRSDYFKPLKEPARVAW